jgi:hypothetical protein
MTNHDSLKKRKEDLEKKKTLGEGQSPIKAAKHSLNLKQRH